MTFVKADKGTRSRNNDKCMTPPHVAQQLIDLLPIELHARILDPFKGNGAFYDWLPTKEWCEIDEGRDFFDYNKPVDWIVSNPPYSIFDAVLDHSFDIPEPPS